MSASVLFTAALLGVAQAYTVVNSAGGPFMLKNVDPIVFPGAFDKSHLHSFYGADGVTASTTTSAELQKSCTTMENPNDLSVYWVPTPLFTTDGGKTYEPIPVFRFSAYYNLGETPAEVAIPQNLKMIAGNSKGTTKADVVADSKVEWFCEGSGGGALDANGFPSETCATHLQQLLYFPNCVNEATLEVAYKSASNGTPNRCPAGMKVMPQLRFSIRYDLRKALPNGWTGGSPFRLSCGNAFCSHGDFINGWTTDSAKNMISTTASKREFSAVTGALGSAKPTCKAADADPSHGTSDFAESVKLMSKRSVESVGWQSKSRFVRA